MPERRALLFGAWIWLDPALTDRPGVTPALRQIAARLEAGGWTVRALVDDSPADASRPLGANLLDGLAWVRGGDAGVCLISGRVRDGHLLPRDARVARLARTAVPLAEIEAELGEGVGVLADVALGPEAFPRARWVVGAGTDPAALQGASAFLARLSQLLAEGGAVSAARVAAAAAPLGGWARGRLEAELLPSLPAAAPRGCAACGATVPDPSAAFCPACGASLAAGDTLDEGRYRLLRRLGEGGMGQVFLAEDTRLKVRRAIKLLALPPGLPDDDVVRLRARMIQEARAAQVLAERTHHVVRVFDVGHCAERGEPFLVMELLEGETLAARLARAPMAQAEAVALGRVLAETLAHGHRRGLVHRDLKPENVMLVPRDGAPFVKVLDYGLVKMEQAEVDTQSGRMMGTLQYMPPEQLKGAQVDARADVFALGAVLYECLAGVRANPGTHPNEVFAVLLDHGVRPLREVAPSLPAGLASLVDACLCLDRTGRPDDAGVVAERLAAFGPQATAPTAPPSAPPQAAPPPRSRWPWAAALALAGGLGWAALGPGPAPSRPDAALPVADAALPADGAPPDAAPPDAARPVPFARPASVPAQTRATLTVAGSRARVEGGADDAARFARLVIEARLGGDDARWQAAPAPVRAWLAAGVPSEGLWLEDGALTLDAPRLASLREGAPGAHSVRRLGEALVADGASPIFLRVRCGRARPGDRLFTARWSTPGYGDGRCGETQCLRAVERALHKARRLGEPLQLTLKLGRGGGGDDETTERVAAHCVVPP